MLPTFGPSTSAGTASGSGDWAEGHAASAADWTSADAYGAATSVYHEDTAIGVRMRTDVADDGATATNGARVQGLLTEVAAGNFWIGARFSIDRVGVGLLETPAEAFYEAIAVFVDGQDAAADDWHGIGWYWSASTFLGQQIERYEASGFDNRARATIMNAPGVGLGPFDVFFVREGTTLSIRVGQAGGVPQIAHSWTVTDEAGCIGFRVQHFSTADLQVVTHAYRVFDANPFMG